MFAETGRDSHACAAVFRRAGLMLLCLIGTSAHAETPIRSQVIELLSYAGHTGVLVRLNASPVNPDGCPAMAWYIYPNDLAHTQFIQSGMMSAMHAQKSVTVTLQGCYQGYPQIRHVSFHKD